MSWDPKHWWSISFWWDHLFPDPDYRKVPKSSPETDYRLLLRGPESHARQNGKTRKSRGDPDSKSMQMAESSNGFVDFIPANDRLQRAPLGNDVRRFPSPTNLSERWKRVRQSSLQWLSKFGVNASLIKRSRHSSGFKKCRITCSTQRHCFPSFHKGFVSKKFLNLSSLAIAEKVFPLSEISQYTFINFDCNTLQY